METPKLKLGQAYSIYSLIPEDEYQKAIGIGGEGLRVFAIWTGEKRAPRKGEWYLSGAIISAYRAPEDFPQAARYPIAKLVAGKVIQKLWLRSGEEVAL